MNNQTIQNRLVAFLNTVTGQTTFSGETDLFDAGATDSLTMMDLLVFVETEFQVRLAFTDLTPEVFRTPATLAQLVTERLPKTQRSAA